MKRWLVVGLVVLCSNIGFGYTPYTDPINPPICYPAPKSYWGIFSGSDGMQYASVDADVSAQCPDLTKGACHRVVDLNYNVLGYVSIWYQATGTTRERGDVYSGDPLVKIGNLIAVPGMVNTLWFYIENPFNFQYYFFNLAH